MTGGPSASVPGSLGCAGCGDCCEQILITRNQADFTAALAHRSGRVAGRWARDAAFVQKWMRPTGDVVREGKVVKQVWTCDAFDPVGRRCTQHAARPIMCSGYPFYGAAPGKGVRDLRCSYWLDVAPADRPEGTRPLIPLTVLGGSHA